MNRLCCYLPFQQAETRASAMTRSECVIRHDRSMPQEPGWGSNGLPFDVRECGIAAGRHAGRLAVQRRRRIGSQRSTCGATLSGNEVGLRLPPGYVDVDVRCAGETSGNAHAVGDQEERRRERRWWSQVVAVGSGLPADVVAVWSQFGRPDSKQRPRYRAAELRFWWRAARDSNPQPPDP